MAEYPGITDDKELTKAEAWASLCPRAIMPSAQELQGVVADAQWQGIRVRMKGTSLRERFDMMTAYVTASSISSEERELRYLRAQNYVYALKRGGVVR